MTGSSNSSSTSSLSNSTGKAMNEALFPFKLHAMLHDAEQNGQTDIVSWLPDGTSFLVHNVPEFVNQILPQYFKQTKYKSFQRQLNLWGYERLTSGPDKGAYFHPQFLRGNPDLCKNLTRQRAKKATTGNGSTPSSTSLSVTVKKTVKAKSAAAARRPLVVPSPMAAAQDASLMPRQVSESSLESFGELFRELDTSIDSTLDLAEFEGFTFHLLEQERYEELNMEFKFNETSTTSPPLQENTADSRQASVEDDEASSVHTLLQELEQGTFGTPETSFEAPSYYMGGNAHICAV